MHEQYEDSYEKVSFCDYPMVGAEVDAWKEGMYRAWRLAKSVEMAPNNDDSSSERDSRDDEDDLDDDVDGANS